jgi:metallopeptidase MepB
MPEPPCRPPRFNHSPNDLLQAAKDLIENRTLLVDRLTHGRKRFSFNETVLPYLQNDNTYIRQRRVLTFYSSTSPDADVRAASRSAATILTNADVELYQRRDFYEAVKTVKDKQDIPDPQYAKYIDDLLVQFEENGVQLSDPEEIKEFVTLKKELREAQKTILSNLDEMTCGVWFTPEELDGLPQNYMRAHTKQDREDPANVWVRFKEPDMSPIYRFAKFESARRKLFEASTVHTPENLELYGKVYSIRDTLAKMLGFKHHADFRTGTQPLGSYARILDFLNQVNDGVQTLQANDLKQMLKVKAEILAQQEQLPGRPSDKCSPIDRIAVWDKAFYVRLVKERACEFDEKSINEYFTFDYSIQQIFKLYGTLFGVKFVAATPREYETLHEDVTLYSVWETGNEQFIGWLIIDPYPRDGKYNHFGHFGLQPV